jgi:hypothetical protein
MRLIAQVHQQRFIACAKQVYYTAPTMHSLLAATPSVGALFQRVRSQRRLRDSWVARHPGKPQVLLRRI